MVATLITAKAGLWKIRVPPAEIDPPEERVNEFNPQWVSLISKATSSFDQDESRCTVTFNYAGVIRFFVLVEDVSGMSDKLFREKMW